MHIFSISLFSPSFVFSLLLSPFHQLDPLQHLSPALSIFYYSWYPYAYYLLPSLLLSFTLTHFRSLSPLYYFSSSTTLSSSLFYYLSSTQHLFYLIISIFHLIFLTIFILTRFQPLTLFFSTSRPSSPYLSKFSVSLIVTLFLSLPFTFSLNVYSHCFAMHLTHPFLLFQHPRYVCFTFIFFLIILLLCVSSTIFHPLLLTIVHLQLFSASNFLPSIMFSVSLSLSLVSSDYLSSSLTIVYPLCFSIIPPILLFLLLP